MAHLYNRIVSVITKPSKDRTDDEIRGLLHWFSKKSRLFESMPTEGLIDVLRNCGFTIYNADQVIIRQGERGDTFYIILSGKVSIYVNTDSVPDNPEEARPSEAAPNAPLDRKKLGNFIVQFDTGKTFGELALINKDCIRNASVVADEPTDLIVINRDLFNRSIRAPQELDLRMRETFVKEHPIFRGWAPRYRRQAVMSVRREQLQFGMVVVKQGDPVNGLTIIRAGQAKVMVDTILHSRQYPNIFTGDAEPTRPSSRLFNNGNLTSRQSYMTAESRLQRRNVELCIVGENEIIGDIELCLGLPTYLQTVVCVQPCEVMILDEKNFERLVVKRNHQALQLLQLGCDTKLRVREDSSVPLIGCLIRQLERQKAIERLRQAGEDYRDPFEIVQHRHAYSMKELQNVLNFLPPRGALVDLYGPGTLFYRNRALRKLKQCEEERIQAKLKLKSEGPSVNNQSRILATSIDHSMKRESTEVSSSARDAYALSKHNGQHTSDCPICNEINRKRAKQSAMTTRASTARSFKDWESSNEYLSELETRVNDWFDFLGSRQFEKQRFSAQIQLPNVTQLKTDLVTVRSTSNKLPVRLQRYKPINHQPVPGVKVVLRRRLFERGNTADAINMSNRPETMPNRNDPMNKSSHSLLTDAVLRLNSTKRSLSPHGDKNSDNESEESSNEDDQSRPKSKKRSQSRSKKHHQVSVDEYNQLKSRMKRKEVDLANFRARVDIA